MRNWLAAFGFIAIVSFSWTPLFGTFPVENRIETFVLENGMRVALKKTNNEPGEVSVRLMAKGGYAALPTAKRVSGKISSEAALRSGLAEMSFDQLHALLYEHSIEFETRMEPFSRSLELSADSEELDKLFHVVHLFFTQSRFSLNAYQAYTCQLLKSLESSTPDVLKQFEELCRDFNTCKFRLYSSLQAKDLEKASYDQSKQFFECSFVDPENFICVVAGDFDEYGTKKLIENHLGAIPSRKEKGETPKIPGLADFPKGIRTKIIKSSRAGCTATRMTFPLQVAVKQENSRRLDAVVDLIKARLASKVHQLGDDDLSLEMRVTFDFPYYPSFHCPWISIQYNSPPKWSRVIGQCILVELKKIQSEGFSQSEIDKVKIASAERVRIEQMDNCYWLNQIANFMIWNWDLGPLQAEEDNFSSWTANSIHKDVERMFSLDNYSIVSLSP